mgnify:CR=1 FL=1
MSLQLIFIAAVMCVLFTYSSGSLAKNTSLNFTNISSLQGLGSPNVLHVVQDPEGFIWAATQDGLFRYDGYQFKHYQHDPEDPYSITDIYINGDTKLTPEFQSGFLGGVSTLKTEVMIRQDKAEGMYSTVKKPEFQSFKTQLIPYFAWSNRGISEMSVFLPVIWK